MNINQVMIAGRLTRDPEMKMLPSGTGVTSFSIATSFKVKDQEQTEYHSIVVFGKQAENAHKYLKKGQIAFVEGRLQTRSWESDGRKNYKTEIIASRVQFGPGEKSQSSGNQSRKDEPKPAQSATRYEYPEDEINPDDIPF